MPKGFIINFRYPELPAAVNFLKQYEGKKIPCLLWLQKELDGFLDYLKKNDIPEGEDVLLRTGLKLEEISKKFVPPNDQFVYKIVTDADNGPGLCFFGGLEEII
jgi:hypothetical protein